MQRRSFSLEIALSDTPWDTPRTEDYPNDRFSVSAFLREVVPVDCLHLMRSLEVTFPPYSRKEWPREDCPALRDWAATIRLIKENMNLGGLTLRLTMFDAPGLDYEGIRKGMTKPEAREVRQAYTRILGTMAGLGEEGLKRFYAHIALPEKWTPWFRYKKSTGEHFTERILKKERILRERAEQLVMGDRYAKQVGDGFYMNGLIREPFRSVWRRNFINRY